METNAARRGGVTRKEVTNKHVGFDKRKYAINQCLCLRTDFVRPRETLGRL